jgi:chromosome condensin MukBEF ATPase and DNA-binding subunit MukB
MNEITRHEQDALVAALQATVRQLSEANTELKAERARLAAERDAAQIAGENYVAAVDALNAVYQTGEQVYGEADMKLIMARDNAFDALRAALGPA